MSNSTTYSHILKMGRKTQKMHLPLLAIIRSNVTVKRKDKFLLNVIFVVVCEYEKCVVMTLLVDIFYPDKDI